MRGRALKELIHQNKACLPNQPLCAALDVYIYKNNIILELKEMIYHIGFKMPRWNGMKNKHD